MVVKVLPDNIDLKLLDSVFSSLVSGDTISSGCHRLNLNLNVYSFYRNSLFQLLKQSASSFGGSVSDLLVYINNISDKNAFLQRLDNDINRSKKILNGLEEKKKQTSIQVEESEKRLSSLNKQISLVETRVKEISQEESVIDQKRRSFESVLGKYGLTLNDFLKLKTDTVPFLVNQVHNLEVWKNGLLADIKDQNDALDVLKEKVENESSVLWKHIETCDGLESEIKEKEGEANEIRNLIDQHNKYTKDLAEIKKDVEDLDNYKKSKLDAIDKELSGYHDEQKEKIDQELKDYYQKTKSELENDLAGLKGEKLAYSLEVGNLRATAENQQKIIDANCEKLMELGRLVSNPALQEDDDKDRFNLLDQLLANILFAAFLPGKTEYTQEQKDATLREIWGILQKKTKEQKESVLREIWEIL